MKKIFSSEIFEHSRDRERAFDTLREIRNYNFFRFKKLFCHWRSTLKQFFLKHYFISETLKSLKIIEMLEYFQSQPL